MARSSFGFEVQLAEFTARHLWKGIRLFLRRHLSKRCRRCIVSTAYTRLSKEGLCPECEIAQEQGIGPNDTMDLRGAQKLDALFRDHAGKGTGPFDAVVLFSGGKDSTYLLHRMLNEYPKLRVVSLLVDNGYMSPFALRNAAQAVRALGASHVTMQLRQSFVDKTFRYALTHLHEQKGYSMVDEMDAHMIFDHGKHFAVRHGIPLVICGLGRAQTETIFGPQGVEFSQEALRAPLTEHAGIPLREVYDEQDMMLWFDGSQFPKEVIPRFLLPMNVWNPNEEEVIRQVTKLGLLNRKHTRPLVTNNALIPVIGMAEVARFGYCSWEPEFAKMVRRGKSDRNYWLAIFEMLEYSTKTGSFINKTVVETLARLGLSKGELGIGTPAMPGFQPGVKLGPETPKSMGMKRAS